MLFNSYIFIFLFFPLTLIGYYGLNHVKMYKAALAFLIGMSLWFYGYNNVYYLAILIVSILINYGITYGISHFRTTSSDKNPLSKLLLFGGIILNIGILFYFKYYDFFISNFNVCFRTSIPLLHLVLPLGISFYTFQQLSYVIDVYRDDCEKYSFLEYAAYVSYFPQLIAGPIVYHSELIPQFRDHSKKQLCFTNLSKGIYAFALGLGKKVLIADTFSKIVTIGYGSIAELNSISVFIVMICYSLQIYFDFSGYCDMAYGMGYMMNIELPINFHSPYKAQSISDFWDRWHMTLTRFFTKYIYIPLGGNRRGKARTCLNILIVYFISGLWHGANWTFIIWGVLHGIASVFERITNIAKIKLPKLLKQVTTFLLVTFAWSLFRANSLQDARLLWNRLFTGGIGPIYQPLTDKFAELTEIQLISRLGLGKIISDYSWLPLILFLCIVFITCLTMKNTQEKVATLKLTGQKMLAVIILMIWSILSLSEISEFLYFNF